MKTRNAFRVFAEQARMLSLLPTPQSWKKDAPERVAQRVARQVLRRKSWPNAVPRKGGPFQRDRLEFAHSTFH